MGWNADVMLVNLMVWLGSIDGLCVGIEDGATSGVDSCGSRRRSSA